jgi:phosphonate transport system permease protein
MTSTIQAARPPRPSRLSRNLWTLAAIALVIGAALTVDVKVERLLDLPTKLWDIGVKMFAPPSWDYIGRAFEGMIASIQIAWIGTIIGAIFSLPLGMLGAKNVSGWFGSSAIRQLLNAIRAIPELVLAAVVFIPIVGLGALPGTLAIGIHSIGTLGKLTAEVVEGIDDGPVEAAQATGANRLQALRWSVLPQVLPDIMAFWLYRFEINVRASAILGVVGAGGIGAILSNTLAYRHYDEAGMTILVIIVTVSIIDAASAWVRRRIIEGGAGSAAAPDVAFLLEEQA